MLTRRLLAVPLLLMLTPSFCPAAEIRDKAALFSSDAIRQAKTTLERAEKSSGRTVMIETVSSLEGRDPDEVVNANADSHTASLYVLFAKKEHKFRFRERPIAIFDLGQESAITAMFMNSLKTGDFDGALTRGSESIATAFSSRPAANRANV